VLIKSINLINKIKLFFQKKKVFKRKLSKILRRLRQSLLYFQNITLCNGWARIAQSVQRLATGWTFRGSNPSGD